MYTAHEISSFFIKRKTNPLKLQKLLYYAQVWHFVKYGELLFSDSISAWKYGPVVKNVWHRYKYMRGSVMIKKEIEDVTYDRRTLSHLEEVYDAYGNLSAGRLVDMTHAELPWKWSRINKLDSEPSDEEIVINSATLKYHNLDTFGNIPKPTPTFSPGNYSNRAHI